MKHSWIREQLVIELSDEALEALLQPVAPGARVAASERVTTGMVNTIYRVAFDDAARPLCVKIGQRGPGAAALEYVIGQLVAGRLPAPTPRLHIAQEPTSGLPCVVGDWVSGVRLDSCLAALSLETRRALTRRLGRLLASLHAIRFDSRGLLAADASTGTLRVAFPFRLDGEGLRAFAAETLAADGFGVARLGAERAARLIEALPACLSVLDRSADDTPCLCHGDFGPENILLDAAIEDDRVAIDDARIWVLDWEFACAGTPSLDLGHLLRAPFLERSEFETLLAEGYRSGGGVLSEGWELAARLTDLFAWLSFVQREDAPASAVAAANGQVDALLGEIGRFDAPPLFLSC